MIPVDVEGGFTTDGSGNGTDKRIIGSGHWTGVYASCQCNGNGQWVAGKNGRAQFFQQGANVLLGPILTRPGEQVQVTVTGAAASAGASIVYWGWQSDSQDGSDLAQVMPSVESAGSLSGSVALSLSGNVPVVNATGTQLLIQNNQVLLNAGGTVVSNNGVQANLGTFTLPVNTHSVEIIWNNSAGLLGLQALHVNGQTTGLDWTTIGAGILANITGPRIVIPVRQGTDAQIQVLITMVNATGSTTVYVLALTDASMVTSDASQPSTTQLVDPQPWQRPTSIPIDFSVQLASSSNVQLIAAPGGTLRLWLHDVQYFYTATSASFGKFRRASGSGTAIASWNSNSAGVFRWGRGAPLGQNEALFLSNDSGVSMAGFFNGTIQYSIG